MLEASDVVAGFAALLSVVTALWAALRWVLARARRRPAPATLDPDGEDADWQL